MFVVEYFNSHPTIFWVTLTLLWYFVACPLICRYILKLSKKEWINDNTWEDDALLALLVIIILWLISPILIPVMIIYKISFLDK